MDDANVITRGKHLKNQIYFVLMYSELFYSILFLFVVCFYSNVSIYLCPVLFYTLFHCILFCLNQLFHSVILCPNLIFFNPAPLYPILFCILCCTAL